MPALVVAALSARWLALSARRGGWNVIALDLFGDVDTRAAAGAWHAIGDADALRIDGERFLAALVSARAEADCEGWIAGPGFEARPDLLDDGARLLPLFGNGRATIGPVRDPRVFFGALAGLAIAFPPTVFAEPADPRGWLAKDFNASGGRHIRRAGTAHTHRHEPGAFFQREAAGRPMSLLFAAADGHAVPLGINELLVRAHGARPYVYHGAIGPVADPAGPLGTTLRAMGDALVRRFALRGLGSLDFLLDGETVTVLELNARPSASLALHDAGFPAGLVRVHVDACRGAPPGLPACETASVRGESIVFAAGATAIAAENTAALLALGCRDVPQPGSVVAAGAPLCTVCAQGSNAAAVRNELARRETAALALVQNRNEASPHVH